MAEMSDSEVQAAVDRILDAEAHPECYHCLHCRKAFAADSEVWVKQKQNAVQFAHVACEVRWRRTMGMPPPRAQSIIQRRPEPDG
ncbi:MAG: hypothetical protein ACR2PL_16940 [Dehalococcoidia bacterium]